MNERPLSPPRAGNPVGNRRQASCDLKAGYLVVSGFQKRWPGSWRSEGHGMFELLQGEPA